MYPKCGLLYFTNLNARSGQIELSPGRNVCRFMVQLNVLWRLVQAPRPQADQLPDVVWSEMLILKNKFKYFLLLFPITLFLLIFIDSIIASFWELPTSRVFLFWLQRMNRKILTVPWGQIKSSANFWTTLERHQVEVRRDDPLQDVDQNLKRKARNVRRLKQKILSSTIEHSSVGVDNISSSSYILEFFLAICSKVAR